MMRASCRVRSQHRARALFIGAGVASAFALTGCQDRRMLITSEPPGALVHVNDHEVGRTPCEVSFTWFGEYDVRLDLDGYEPVATSAKADAPLHEQPGLDLIAMAIPGTSRTRINWHYTLTPQSDDPQALLQRAGDLRGMLGAPEAPPPSPASKPPVDQTADPAR